MENISAVGLPPEEGGQEDPYLFDVYNLLKLVDAELIYQDPKYGPKLVSGLYLHGFGRIREKPSS